jgi:hypothetical protein
MHELAHVLGYGDTSSGLMSEYLAPGTRLAPAVDAASGVGSHGTGTAAISGGSPSSAHGATGGVRAQGSNSETPLTAPLAKGATARDNLFSGAAFVLPKEPIVVPPTGSAAADSLPSASYVGSLTQSEITLGSSIPSLSLRSGGLIGSPVELDVSRGWSGESSAWQSGDATSPAVEEDTPTAPIASSHAATKRVALNSSGTDAPEGVVAREKTAFSQDWLDDFLNNLGQNGSLGNPNAGIRIRPNAGGTG